MLRAFKGASTPAYYKKSVNYEYKSFVILGPGRAWARRRCRGQLPLLFFFFFFFFVVVGSVDVVLMVVVGGSVDVVDVLLVVDDDDVKVLLCKGQCVVSASLSLSLSLF